VYLIWSLIKKRYTKCVCPSPSGCSGKDTTFFCLLTAFFIIAVNFNIIILPFDPKNYKFSTDEHQDKQVIFVKFPYDQVNDLKGKFSTAKWSVSQR